MGGRTTSHWFARGAVSLLAVAAVAAGGGGIAVAAPDFPTTFPPDQNQLPQLPREPDLYDQLPIKSPDKDPWYNDPPNMAAMKPGQIVRTRDVTTRLLGIPVPVTTRQILFRSEDTINRPVVTATTLLIPGVPWVGSSRPIMSYHEAIDSTDSSCNPSFTLQVGTMKESTLMASWLAQGFAVNVPDFDGKNNIFTTFGEGKMVLDSLRAVKNDTKLNLKDSGIAMYGFSGGGSATVRAAELRKTYAPDVKILGAAFGGTPGDLPTLARYGISKLDGLTGIGNFTMWLGLVGFSREYPEQFDTKKLLNADGQKIIADVDQRCVFTAAATGFYRPLSKYFLPGKSLENSPDIMKVLTDNSLGRHIPDIPMLWSHGFFDEAIPQSTVLPTLNKYWDAGANLRYYTSPTAEHLVNDGAIYVPQLAWISAILRGADPGPRFKLDYQPLPSGFPGT